MWRPFSQLLTCKAPSHLRAWLMLSGSMTDYLRGVSHNTLQVKILNQSWGKATLSECKALGLPYPSLTYIRETVLYAYGKPWMYGRSIFPIKSLTGKNKFLLKALDHRPLGDLLYRDPNLLRGKFEFNYYTKTTKYSVLDLFLKKNSHDLWARRSVFSFNKKPLLVTEILLPQAEKFFYARNFNCRP